MKKAEIKSPVDKARGHLDDHAEEPTVRKHAGGRPLKYDAGYHPAKLVELCEGGLSFAACAGEFRIARETVYDWAEKFSEFSDAKRTAESLALLFWERQNIKLAQTGEGNATATVFGLKNRSRKGERRVPDWQDISRQEFSGPNGGPIPIERIVIEIVDPKDGA